MRKCELIKQSKLLKIKKKISNLFNEKYELKLEESNNITGTEKVDDPIVAHFTRKISDIETSFFFTI